MRHSTLPLACALLVAMSSHAATPEEIDAARANGLAWLVKHQKGDGAWYAHDSLRVQSTAAALDALFNAGMTWGETYGAGVAWLANADAASIDASARKVAALARAGVNTDDWVQALLAARPMTDRQAWGSYPGHAMSFPDTPLGLAAVRLSGHDYPTRAMDVLTAIACQILPAQRGDGGWPYVPPAAGAPAALQGSALMPTALTLLELAAQRDATGWHSLSCGGGSYTLTTALGNGASFLLARRNGDDGFGEKGVSTVLDTALAYLALRAIHPEHAALEPARDYLLTGAGAPDADGGWRGDPLSTALVLQTFPKVNLADQDGDGLPDAVEIALGQEGAVRVRDGRQFAPGTGQAVVGYTTPLLLPNATLGRPYRHSLAQAGLADFALVTGSLPPGLTLGADGLLSGAPNQLGEFSFQFQASPAHAQLAKLRVHQPGGDGDVPLPGWALALLGAGLAGTLLRRGRLTRPV